MAYLMAEDSRLLREEENNSRPHPEDVVQEGASTEAGAGGRSSTAPEPENLRDYDPEEGSFSPKEKEREFEGNSTSEESSEDEFGETEGIQWGDLSMTMGLEEMLLREEPPPPGEN